MGNQFRCNRRRVACSSFVKILSYASIERGISGLAHSFRKSLDGSTSMFQRRNRAEVFRSWFYWFM